MAGGNHLISRRVDTISKQYEKKPDAEPRTPRTGAGTAGATRNTGATKTTSTMDDIPRHSDTGREPQQSRRLDGGQDRTEEGGAPWEY